jgi:hypothetical protein
MDDPLRHPVPEWPPPPPAPPLPASPIPQAYPARPTTNGLSVAALVLSITGTVLLCVTWVGGVVGIPGAVLGHKARRQIRASGQAGDRMATAGIIIGWISGALGALAGLLLAAYLVWEITWGLTRYR